MLAKGQVSQMGKPDYAQQGKAFEQFISVIDDLALQFPHRAVASYSDKTNTYFYNVYFTTPVEEALDALNTDNVPSYLLLSDFAQLGYNFSFKPKNKQGFCQATVSYTVEGTRGKETHLLSGEGGTIQNAIISCYVKFRLILTPDGDWSFTASMMKSDKKFR